MTIISKYQSLLRKAFILTLMLCFAVGAGAQTLDKWKAAEAVKPSGSGTISDPYTIATPANLFWVSLNVGKNGTEKAGASDKYYVQTADIDLAGKEWMPIGNNIAGGFFASYDGRGHKISNMTVDWGGYALALSHAAQKTDAYMTHERSSNISYGLFGWFGGKVENLVIENATIMRENISAADLTEDLKIGVLAGIVGDSINQGTRDITIKNIIVRSSRITDSGSDPHTTAYMVGGLIGDVNSGAYSGTNNVTSNISISNVAVHTDIDLAQTNISGTGNDSKGHQYYVGGIVGRLRSVKHEHAPAKVIFSGSIDAPMGVTGPIFGFARTSVGTTQSYDNFAKGYDGEFTDAKGVLSSYLFFGNYYVRGTQITATEPEASTSADRKYTFRTLKSIADSRQYTYDREGMKMFQGVNHGLYKDMTDASTRADVREKLNIGNEDATFRFIWVDDHFELQGLEEVIDMERTSIFRFKARVINLKDEKEYTYKWTLSDASGNTWSASCPAAPGATQTNDGDAVLKILSADRTYPMVAIVGEMRPYHSLMLEVFDGETMLTSKTYDKIDDVEAKIARDIFTTSTTTQVPETDAGGNPVLDDEGHPVMKDVTTVTKEHFLFKADLKIGGISYADNPAFFDRTDIEWLVLKGSDDTAVPDADGFISLDDSEFKAASTTGSPFPADEAHILSTYVGNIRLRVTCSNPDDPAAVPLPITSSIIGNERKDFLEMVNNGLHLSITMDECTIGDGGAITTYTFNPADYFLNTAAGNQGFYDRADDKYDAEGNLSGAKAKMVKPLIFKVKVVDQFGNDWTAASDALSHYRIQWNYRIPGEGVRGNASQYCDKGEPFEDGNGYYCTINGQFDLSMKDDAEAPYGLKSDLEMTAWNYNKDINEQNFSGHIKLIGDSILIIHPNLLHRTIGFWVRAKLFDIENDSQGHHPTEEILAFNQLGIKISKTADASSLEGKVIWKLDSQEGIYSSSSTCDLIWYKSSDPTDPTKWTKVQETLGENSRFTTLNSTLYDPDAFYKLTYKSGNNIEVEQIFGPQNVVYVYDRAQTIANRELHSFDPYDDFTNKYYATGKNTNHGHDPYNAVLTMSQAYKLIDENAGADQNVIVLMGYMADPDFLYYGNTNGDYRRNATITGAYGSIKGSTLYMVGENQQGILLRGVTKFRDLTLYGGGRILHFYCGLNDVTFGKGMRMVNYANQTPTKNGLGNYKSQQTTIIGGFHNYDNTGLTYSEWNQDPGERLTMTFQSGTFGRIISGARTNGPYNKKSFNIFGHPQWPHRVKVVIDIDEDLTDDQKAEADYNIGLLVGGQTDGSLYSDTEIVMSAGTVGRYISGNISYGRAVGDEHPADTYFGSTKLDLYGGQIHELYGGTLGRHAEAEGTGTATCDAFFYGRSIINVHAGTINSKIFGAGAGGVTGLGDAANHTPDRLIPYYKDKDETQLLYGDFDTATNPDNAIPTILLLNADDKLAADGNGDHRILDLSKTYVEVNIMGGTVNDNVYGGAYGYSDNITYDKAIEQAGYLYGECLVNISGGTIEGNVYGAGAGSNIYNTKDPEHFKEVACVFGNTSVNITGGTIIGSVYGGGQGILGFDSMAKLTGNTSVEISGDTRIIDKEENGNSTGGYVYGGASFGEIHGCTDVKLHGGYISGNVFGGSEGDPGYPSAATIYGKTCLLVDGAHINANIYGGCNVSSIRKPEYLTDEQKAHYGVYTANNCRIAKSTAPHDVDAMTKVIINSGTIGNNIYGGSRGDDTAFDAVTDIEGDTYVRINGGSYKNVYYFTDKDDETVTDSRGNKIYRDFNIFGGGEKKCTVAGTAHLDVRSGLMNIPGMQDFIKVPDGDEVAESKVLDGDVHIFIPHAENPNSLATDDISKFQGPYMDITYRRFSLYGGGYGEHTNCLNTDVYVYIPTTARKPHGRTLQVPYDHQSYFDIAGGGYSGDIGYWTDADGHRVGPSSSVADYDHYVGGQCSVTIDGFTFCRKVIGGGFYGSCLNTDTKIICGSLRQVYGGSLLGYVHDRAYLEIGNRPADLDTYTCETPQVNAMTPEDKAKWLNDRIFFTENVYGGNDVKGIVGTQKWSWTDGAKETVGGTEQLVTYYGREGTDGGPLWQADVDKEETKGVVMNIYGGTFMGDVFGAGNGHYRGYYVPGWMRYDDGPARIYRMVRGIDGLTYAQDLDEHPYEDPASVMARHRVYRTRPMVGSVNINIAGNKIVRKDDGSIDESLSDYVKFQQNFYGGGADCSIGQWNTILPMEDPRRLSVGGHLHLNIGGNVNFAKNLYMGNYGKLFGEQKYLPAGTDIDLDTFDGSTTEQLVRIGDLAYDHWFFNSKEGHNRYEPGFPEKGEADGNFGLLGEHMFRGYFKNIEMEGDIELTFYKDLYKRQDLGDGNYGDYLKDEDGNLIRRRWLPAELAVDAYDAEDITIGSFFLGGKCGYMTNNTYNVYCYTDEVGKHLRDVESETVDGHVHEKWGSVYRIVMPQGVTIKDKLVMGVEDAITHFYKYNDDFTAKAEPEPTYTFEGGLVTQTTYSFDHIAYNDMMTKENNGVWNPTIFLPEDFYQNTKYEAIRDANSYTLQSGIYAGMTIFRRIYTDYGLTNYMLRPNPAYTGDSSEPEYLFENNQEPRYGLAVVYNDGGTHHTGNEPGAEPLFGRRSSRTPNGDDRQTVTKLTARCRFEPQVGEGTSDEANYKFSNDLRYGGVIYGGCYNSGVVIGDVILNVASDMIGKHLTEARPNQIFGDLSSLSHYVGRVYGGGYGPDTRNDGDTYINLLRDVRAMNVFGGGMQGSVYGDTYINYSGRDDSYIYGAIYGGGFRGAVGKYYWRENFDKTTITPAQLDEINDPTRLLSQAEYDRLPEHETGEDGVVVAKGKDSYHLYVASNGTNVTLISGNVDHVYGGACMSDMYGATRVHLYDEAIGSLPHLDFSQYGDVFKEHWAGARLIVGTVYGGNDISGEVIHTDDRYQTREGLYDTNVEMSDYRADSSPDAKNTPGAINGYNGYPLVGNLYGGSNGDYGKQTLVKVNEGTADEKQYYVYKAGSKIEYATGIKNRVATAPIGGSDTSDPMLIPNIGRASIDIQGGTVVNLYGGGDMSTVTENTNIRIAYSLDKTTTSGGTSTTTYGNIEARAGFNDDAELQRVWNTCHVTSQQQTAEIMDECEYETTQDDGTGTPQKVKNKGYIFKYNIYRVFGGNNHADMDIQPSWQLVSGHVGSVYSGANFGKMTYYKPAGADPTQTAAALSLTVDSPNFHANALYGGGRVGDIHPAVPAGTATSGLYGATLTIKQGVIDHVYGGNDVAGEVHYGSRVDIQGAISGDVYCAGNGAHIYQYGYPDDYEGDKDIIGEDYIITDQETKSGYRYFILPLKDELDAADGIQALKAINSYRPNVARSNLTIGSTDPARPAYVHGSIYMGGNSATVLPSKEEGSDDFISFNIGSNIIVNNIFMGSNGENLVDENVITHTNERNGFNIGSSDAMLDEYFRAVQVEGLPKDFVLDPNTTNVNIGGFFLGGNRGSMTTDKTISLEFPENITIYGKIVGGSNNANYEYGMATHTGGLTATLAEGLTEKVHMKVRSKFLPMYLKYPDNDWRKASLEVDLRDDQGNVVYRQYEGGVAKAYRTRTLDEASGTYTYSDEYTGLTYLQPGKCNIYGGCYNSGRTVGDIKIELYSDMLLFDTSDPLGLRTREQTVVNCDKGIDQKTWHPLSVIGGGYGSGTSVYGNINVQLLPTVSTEGSRKVTHPSCNTVFGGAQEGLVVGNTTVELRDGTVLANVYGASESSYLYGSTQILIGYPDHYECLEGGMFTLRRADIYSHNAVAGTLNSDGSQVVKRNVWYRTGDIVPKNVYELILAAADTESDKQAIAAKFKLHNEDQPSKLVDGITWDDIEINVGDPSSRNVRSAAEIASTPYFGNGNVYGGGHVPTEGNSALIGQKTLRKFTDAFKPIGADASITNYGGNSSIMIWDNPENAEMNDNGTGYRFEVGSPATGTGASGAIVRDHVSIGSGKFILVDMTEGKDKMGLFYYKPASGGSPAEFVHQPSGKYSATADAGKTFYQIESDGGIYGGGRKVFCEGFRACDLAYYGYADFTPQMAKLINTFQRFDILSLTDCCLQLQAAQDFASTTGEKYSITRVGELRMNSSLAGKSITLDPGEEDELNIGNTNHLKPRSRNFLGFFRSVKFLGALVSNVDFGDDRDYLHDKDGAEDDSQTYFTNKQKIVDAYYEARKREELDNNDPVTNEETEAFKKRNVATAANMIGINNGYSLRIQGTHQTKTADQDVDEGYYGPAIGVTEIKLLTMAIGEGGGYVYALNRHHECEPGAAPETPGASTLAEHAPGASATETPSFLQTLGNFVFPGAKFGMPKDDGTPTLNYIIDDCYPIGYGYDKYMADETNHNNVNNAQEIHYWYVNGQRYFFNATLTAYTSTPTDEKPSSLFTLDDAENLLLAGLEKGNDNLHIKSVTWEAPNGDYDLTRDADSETAGVQLVPGYDLYITVGDHPQELIKPSDSSEKKAGTWASLLAREDCGETASSATFNASMPLLGIALTDAVSNNAKDYYTDHLSLPGKVKVVLAATDSDDLDYEYTVNLTIVYLKGTDINGNIVIENCALPGERIYANAFDVKVEGDNPTITNRRWVMYKVITTFDDDGNVETTTPMEDIYIPDGFLVEENSPERVAIPAYYWMDGWHLAYQMNINGKTERVYVSTDEATDHKVIDVHNYHRMMAWDRNHRTEGGDPDVRDLQLTAGARVYIEDADDLEYFLSYMRGVQAADCSGRGAIGSAELPADYDSHVVVNPRYAEGIHFILLDNVKMKDAVTEGQDFKFAGRFSGMGHVIDMNKCPQLMGEIMTDGSVYFTGFVSKGNTKVVATNNGRFFGSFHYNPDHTGRLAGNVGADDRLQYCFQNSCPGIDHYGYTTYYDDLDFANGKAAYDLNAFYLNERYKKATSQPGNENDRFKSYVYNYYGDGEYRFAAWDKAERKGTATALRTDAHPNYYIPARITAEEMDALTDAGAAVSPGVGAAAFSRAKTYHNCDHTADGSRNHVAGHYVDVIVGGVKLSEWIPDYYEPNYPQDFMFWGQDINGGEKYPATLSTDGVNRVFRASGFYGSQEDRGFYFNREEAVMRHPSLTAVDFTGQRTRDRVPSGDVSQVYLFQPLEYVAGGMRKQTIIFPPVLDLPASGEDFEGTTKAADMDLSALSVEGNAAIAEVGKVTKNLLVYIPADKLTTYEFPQDTEKDIEAHRIDWNGTGFSTGEFHLVDKQDFNAPIPFSVTTRAWYEREPLHYASRTKSVANNFVIGKDAWEGISLPFTPERVKAVNNVSPGSTYTDRGEITHFYADSETHHDYWLRGLTDTAEDNVSADDDVIASACFARPGAATGEQKLFDLGADQEAATYLYDNNWLFQTYGNKGYMESHNEYADPITFEGYRFLTKNAPYIVAYPGEDFYEFDLSGEFFKRKTNVENRQKIVYENSNVPFSIEITDEEAAKRITVVTGADGTMTTHCGTFAHLADNNFFVINEADVDNVEVYDGTDNEIKSVSLPAGSVFINCEDFDIDEVLPFRTYLTVTLPEHSPAPKRFVIIGSGSGNDQMIEDDDNEPADSSSSVEIYVRDNNLVIKSDHDFTCPLYGVTGILYRNLAVKAGVNVYRNLDFGVYIALGKKFLIR